MGTVSGGYWTISDEEKAMHEAIRAGTHTLAYDTQLGRLVLVPKASEPPQPPPKEQRDG